jgi:hypothetical protein
MIKNNRMGDEFIALSLMVSNSAKTMEQVAYHLFPDMPAKSAYAKLAASFNPDSRARLTFAQILSAMQFCNCYLPLMYLCDETHHARPERKSPDAEQFALVQTIQTTAEILQKAMAQLQELQKLNK